MSTAGIQRVRPSFWICAAASTLPATSCRGKPRCGCRAGGRQENRALAGAESAGIRQGHGQNSGLLTQNADPPYAAASVRVIAHNLKGTPLRLSNLRAPGKIANVFAAESFADEMAVAVGMDGVAFRRRGLSDPARLPCSIARRR